MDMLKLKDVLKANGFVPRIGKENLLQKNLRNGWFITVDITGTRTGGESIIVDAIHITQADPNTRGGHYCYLYDDRSNHLWYKADGITVNKKYVRNKEGHSFKSASSVMMAVSLLEYRLK
jgi:hypothetical protein